MVAAIPSPAVGPVYARMLTRSGHHEMAAPFATDAGSPTMVRLLEDGILCRQALVEIAMHVDGAVAYRMRQPDEAVPQRPRMVPVDWIRGIVEAAVRGLGRLSPPVHQATVRVPLEGTAGFRVGRHRQHGFWDASDARLQGDWTYTTESGTDEDAAAATAKAIERRLLRAGGESAFEPEGSGRPWPAAEGRCFGMAAASVCSRPMKAEVSVGTSSTSPLLNNEVAASFEERGYPVRRSTVEQRGIEIPPELITLYLVLEARRAPRGRIHARDGSRVRPSAAHGAEHSDGARPPAAGNRSVGRTARATPIRRVHPRTGCPGRRARYDRGGRCDGSAGIRASVGSRWSPMGLAHRADARATRS